MLPMYTDKSPINSNSHWIPVYLVNAVRNTMRYVMQKKKNLFKTQVVRLNPKTRRCDLPSVSI